MNRAVIEKKLCECDLSRETFDFLLNCRCEFEWLDYKLNLRLKDERELAKFAKDALGMKNMGGGYIILGVRDRTWEPKGLQCPFPYDAKELRDKVFKATGLNIEIFVVSHTMYIRDELRSFALIHFHASRKRTKRRRPSVIAKDFHPREAWGLRTGDIYVRRGDSTERISSQEQLEDLLDQLEILADEDDLRAPGRASPFAVQDGLYRLLEKGYLTFIGRKELRRQVLDAVMHDPRIWIVNVHGPGGVGKSAVVNWVTYQFYDTRKFEAIIQLSAKETRLTPKGIEPHGRSLYSLENLLDHVLRTFQESTSCDLETKKTIAIEYLSAWSTLLVLDNMETLSDGRVLEFLRGLPPETKAKVLMTSRQRTGGWELSVPVRELSLEETAEFLRIKSEEMDARFPVTPETCNRVHGVTGGLPLAIQWVIGRFKMDHNTTVVLDLVRSKESPVLEFSFRNIWEGLSSEARATLASMSIFDHPPTAQELVFATEWPLERIECAMVELSETTLAERLIQQADGRTVYVALPITLSFAGHQLASMGDFERVCRTRVQRFSELLELEEYESERFTRAFRRYGIESESERKAAVLCRRGQSEIFGGNPVTADALFQQARELAPLSAYVYSMSAVYELMRHRTNDALSFASQACKLADRGTGGLANSTLAQVLWITRDKNRRVQALRNAVDFEPENVIYRHQLGVALSIAGRSEESVNIFTEIINLEKKKLPPRETLIMSLKTRIINLRRLNRHEEAQADLIYAEQLLEEYPYLKTHAHHITDLRDED